MVHERPLSRTSIYRYLTTCEPVEVEVTVLSCADRLATRGRHAERAIAAHLELARELMPHALKWRAEGPPPRRFAVASSPRRSGSSRGRSWGRCSRRCARHRSPARSRRGTRRSPTPGGCVTIRRDDRRLRRLRGGPAEVERDRRSTRPRAPRPPRRRLRLDRAARADSRTSSTRSAREFDLHELAVEDAIKAHQRPKLEVYGDSLFVVLQAPPATSTPTRSSSIGEILMFVDPAFIISVRHGAASALGEVRGASSGAPSSSARARRGPARDRRPGRGRLRAGDRRHRAGHPGGRGGGLLRRLGQPRRADLPARA